MNPKKEAQICHTIAVLISLLGDYTDDLTPNGPVSKKFKEKAEELMPLCEEMLSVIYNVPEISSGTYLSDLSNKIDTIIRKNFERIV